MNLSNRSVRDHPIGVLERANDERLAFDAHLAPIGIFTSISVNARTSSAGEQFEYASYCPLETQWGTMEGTFLMEREDGETFEVQIGRFYLIAQPQPA